MKMARKTMLLYCFLSCALLLVNVHGQGNGAIRLFNKNRTSDSFSSGIVQVYLNSAWGNICASGSNSHAGDAVCHQLGYSGGKKVPDDSFWDDPAPQVIRDFNCKGSELTVLQCSYSEPPNECPDADDLAVKCDETRIWENPFSGYVRLNGTSDYTGSGLVEVYCNSEWGTICASGFKVDDVNTVCRQLGYTAGTVNNRNKDGSMSVWLSTPDCGSSAQCISECKSCPSTGEKPSCGNSKLVAGVICSYFSDNDISGKNNYCSFSNDFTNKNVAGIVVGVLFVFLLCVALAIIIPLCVCHCRGVGIGATIGRRTHSRRYDTF